MSVKWVALCAFVLPVSLLSGCAGDVHDLDRTQPGKIKKSAITGEWYFRQTVIDVPYATGVTFIGEQSYLERVRFEVSEDFLTAYRTYERVVGAERPSTLPGTEYQGAPVAAFRILGHFDVKREYSAATGEQTNVVVENSFDRPWYEREYMRVDWSTNLLANFDFLAGGEEGLNVLAQAASYVVTDPENPEAPVFGVKNGTEWDDTRDPMKWGKLSKIDYFDLTHKLQVTPETFDMWYEDGTVEKWPACWFYDLGPWDCASQTVKVRASFLRVPGGDYEALYYPDNYVARDQSGKAIRVNYFEGRRCEQDETVDCEQVRIPMFDWFGYFRTERETYDSDYGVTEEGRLYLANRFNIWQQSRDGEGDAIPLEHRQGKPVVYHLSEDFPAELLPAAQEVATWWSDAFKATVDGVGATGPETMFQVVPNTYKAEGGKVVDFGQRNGDLRYNHLYYVRAPQLESLLGYGPSAADPLTGEIIAADAYVYGGAIDIYAAQAADMVDLMRGDILETEFIEGENVGRAVAQLGRAPIQPDGASMRNQAQNTMQRGVQARLKNVRERGKQAYQGNRNFAKSRLSLADNDPRFDALWNNEMQQALEPRFGRQLKPSEMGGARLARALRKHRMELGKRGVDLVAFDDQAVLASFERLKNLPREEIIATVRADVFKSTGAHEVGHTVGLRHNFAGSTDAINYFDQYWNVRDLEARALDLPTDDEARAGLREFSYSSIMDYGAKWVSDIQGLGKYDVAAVKFGYGQLVEAFVRPPWYEDHAIISEYYGLRDAVQEWTHYTDLPTLFATDGDRTEGVYNMRDRYDVPMSDIVDYMTMAPTADDYTDALVPYKFCSDEYVGAQWDCDVWDEGADPYEIVNHATQTWRDYYLFHAFKRHRRYLDPWEYYDSTYGRTMLPLSSQYQLWIYDQWFKTYEWDFIFSLYEGDDTTVENADWNLDPHGGLTATAAAMTSMNFLAEVLGTPEPGSYYVDPQDDVLYWFDNAQVPLCGDGESSETDYCSDGVIPLGRGRYAYSEFAADTGYYWYERVRVVGSFWDKLAALETLVDPTTYFLGVDDSANVTQYILGFNVAFPHAVNAIVGAMINDDYKYYAPTMDEEGELAMPHLFSGPATAYGDEIGGDLLSRPGPFVDPATNFTVSLYALYYGMALLNANFEQTFNDFAKIWVDGNGEAFNPAPGSVITEFTNPYNNRVYKAIQSPDAGHYSLGYEMLTRAEAIKLAIDEGGAGTISFTEPADAACDDKQNHLWSLQNLIENIEVARGYYDIFGYAWF